LGINNLFSTEIVCNFPSVLLFKLMGALHIQSFVSHSATTQPASQPSGGTRAGVGEWTPALPDTAGLALAALHHGVQHAT
jgi:hypothetical protein